MNPLKLRFAGIDAAQVHAVEMPLTAGVHAIGRDAMGVLGPVEDAAAASVCFCVDRRGVWLTVSEGAAGVHVNGRPVRRMAMLRAGDTIHADGTRIVLAMAQRRTPPAPEAAEFPADHSDDLRVLLRGVGGQLHGRSFTLDRPRLIGSASDADIRIDDPAFAGRHARIELQNAAIVLRDLGSRDGCVVNGEPVRDALLHPGDQIVFDSHRFVIEAPGTVLERTSAASGAQEKAPASATSRQALIGSGRRLPWLLLAAVLIAAALGTLLLFGVSA